MGPLNISIKGIDTSMPTLAVGEYRVRITGHEFKESQKTPGMWMVRIKGETEEPATTTKGATVKPGFPVSTQLVLPGYPGSDEEKDAIFTRNIAAFVDAVFGTDQDTRPDFSQELLDQIVGKIVIVKIGKAKDDQFGETEVKSFKNLPTA